MKKSEYLKELDQLQAEAEALNAGAKLELESAQFYNRQVNELLKKADDSTLDWQEKESVMKQMESLLKKLNYETKMGEENKKKDTPKMEAIMKRLSELTALKESGQVVEG